MLFRSNALQVVDVEALLAEILQEPGAEQWQADPLETIHACPGYEMAIGVMLGMMTTLLLAGTLRPTASPTIVTLVT